MKRRLEIARALIHNARILFLDEPTVGLDAQSRARVWQYLNDIRVQRQTTIVVTTHYIEEAEQIADRIGVIHNGELIVVEDKAQLMRKLGKKQLTLHLQQPLPALPAELADWRLELGDSGHTLVYTFDAQQPDTGIAQLLRRLNQLAIDFKDLHSSESSLEEIFVNLVRTRA